LLETFALALPLAFAAGLNLYLTVAVIGWSNHLGLVSNLPPGLDIFAAWPVLIAASLLYAIEFLADKVPYFDLLWNFIHTAIRPVGAVLMATGIAAHIDPQIATIAMLAAGATALTSHTTKTSARILINTSPEPVSNIVVSILEDLAVVALVSFTLQHPQVGLAITLGLLAVLLLMMPFLLRWVGFWLQATDAVVKVMLGGQRTQLEALPAYAKQHSGLPEWSVRCRCRGLRGLSGKEGYLSLLSDSLCFSYTHFPARKQSWTLPLDLVQSINLHRQWLLAVINVRYRATNGQSRTVSFVFMKDHTLLAAQLADKLSALIQMRQARAEAH